MIPGTLDPLAIARISLVTATTTDIYNSQSPSDTTAPTLTPSEIDLLACFRFPPSVFPSVDEPRKERSLELSPAYASNFNDITTGGSLMPPPPEPTNRSIQSPFEADYSMRSMDYLYQANFYEYIKDESNVAIVTRHLNRVIGDYKLRTVACGLRWLIGDWSTDSTVRLLRSIMKEWLPDVAGLLVDLIHDGVLTNASGSSTFYAKDVGKLTAGLLKGESPAVSAVFMHSLTETWTLKAVSDLISDVDALLGWNELYFHQFTNSYIACVIHTTSIRSLGLAGPKRKSNRSIFSNQNSDVEQESDDVTSESGVEEEKKKSEKSSIVGEKADEEGSAGSCVRQEDKKENDKSGIVGEIADGGSTGSQHTVEMDGSRPTVSNLGKSGTLERLSSIYQTNLAVCNYRLALANFKLALLENNMQCDLNRIHALNLAASRHSSFSGSTPNLHFGKRKDDDDSEPHNKKNFQKGDSRSHLESLISLRWSMPSDASSPAVSDRLDLTASTMSVRTLRGLDVGSSRDQESVPLSILSGVGQSIAHFGNSPLDGRRRRISCPGRVCHAFWHVDPTVNSDGICRAVPSVSVPSTERSSRRSSQVSANSANDARSTRSLNSRTSDQNSAPTQSSCARSRRSTRRSIRRPPANFLHPSTLDAGLNPPKANAQDLTIQTLNRLSRPAPILDTAEDSCTRPPRPTVPSSETRPTPTAFRSSSSVTAHRTEHQTASYNYRTSRSGRASVTSQTYISSSSSSSSSSSFSSNSYDPSDAHIYVNPPIQMVYPNYQQSTYPSIPAAGYPCEEIYDLNPQSLFSVPPDRIRNHHPVHIPPFPYNNYSSTSYGENQEKSLSEINDFLNTNSRPVSSDRLEYRRAVGVPGDGRRGNIHNVASASLCAPAGTCNSTCLSRQYI